MIPSYHFFLSLFFIFFLQVNKKAHLMIYNTLIKKKINFVAKLHHIKIINIYLIKNHEKNAKEEKRM